MDHIMDVFNDDAFSVVSLTRAINKVPNMYGLLNQLGLFRPEPVDTTIVGIEIQEGVLNLVPPTERGGPGTPNKRDSRTLRNVSIPHFALNDQVKADDLLNVRAFGSGNRMLSVAEKVAAILEQMARKLFITQEFMRNGALNGLILDSAGSTILNLWDLFGITQKTVDFELETEGSSITEAGLDAKEHMEKSLKGENMTKPLGLCSPSFWRKLITHSDVVEAYKYYTNTPSPLREDVRGGFEHQGIIWREYLGEATAYAANGEVSTTRVFIPANSALILPLGTYDTFEEFYAPADYLETVGTMGLPLYSKMGKRDAFDKNQPLEAQTNYLPIVRRPEVLVKAYFTPAE